MKQMRNAYYMIDGNTSAYYLGNDGKAVRGIRQFTDANGKKQVEAYNNQTMKQMRNAYYMIDGNTSAYYLGSNGKAVRGVRQFTDANGRKQVEAYNNQTMKQMRNAYYAIDNNTSAYYLGSNGKAVTGERWFTRSNGALGLEYYGSDFKQVRNQYVRISGKNIYFGSNGLATNTNAQMLEVAISWFQARKGKVDYSMYQRLGPNSYDCSSAVYLALKQAGLMPNYTMIGNTETLFVDLEAQGWTALPAGTKPQRGDIFIWGKRGTTLGAGGHTGIFTSSDKIIHCNYADNGISETNYNQTFANSGLYYATIYRAPRL
ncbi:hypothetical protein WVIC16_130001 [Weissella viridescens]|nr:hypothetical protein WVIC16_130001 [Weissella viridescens]